VAGGRDIALLVGRVLLGAVLMAHGYEKFFQWGLGGTSARFTQLGVPMPGPSALYAASEATLTAR
jgi:putative oxidoreductase